MISANIALETFGIVITLLLLSCCLIDKAPKSRSSELYMSMLIINTAVLGCDLLTWIFHGREDVVLLLHIVNSLVYIFGYVLTALFTNYITDFVKCSRKTARSINIIISAACAVAAALVIASYFNGMYFYYVGGEYTRGGLYWLSQAYPICILVFDMIFILCNSRKLERRDLLSLLSYGALPAAAMLIQIYVFGITLLYLATTLSLQIIYIFIYLNQSRKIQQQEAELQKARVSIMLSQIQPHFLYNSLSVIQALCDTNPHVASTAMSEFSDFLRGNMDSLTMDRPIPFESELNHAKHYLSLEKLRFQDAVSIEYDIQATLFRLPALTLQPIVENAVRYGITKRENGGTVRISSYETAESFVVTVVDNGTGFVPDTPKDDGKTHIGISNVEKRLKDMCGGGLIIKSTLGIGTEAVITIPKTGDTV